MTSEPTRRLFFAFWPDETLRAAFAHATHKAARACGGRPVPAHNLHSTVLFLGSVAEARIPDLVSIGSRAAGALSGAGTTPELVFDRIEFWEKARVLVAATEAAAHASFPSPGLAIASALALNLLRATQSAGFAPDLKPFRPHVTLARKVAKVPHLPAMRPVPWLLTDFALVESKTLPDGPVYTVVARLPARGN